MNVAVVLSRTFERENNVSMSTQRFTAVQSSTCAVVVSAITVAQTINDGSNGRLHSTPPPLPHYCKYKCRVTLWSSGSGWVKGGGVIGGGGG
jgi:hypothetical protein